VATSVRFHAHLELEHTTSFWDNTSPIGMDICASDPKYDDNADDASMIRCDDSSVVFGNGNKTNSPTSICHPPSTP
jgi:hypothetical protein